ncbi:MAG TPA: hypothetical protein VFV17_06760 [Usitatibacteraceae bacterium]|nr:hypothetical protein [Usitatibacteraceae bacterium]
MELNYTVHDTHLLVRASGDYEPSRAFEVIENILKHCRAGGIDRVLIDGLDLCGSPSVGHRFALGERGAEALGGAFRIAVVTPPDIHLPSKILQNTANNRGGNVFSTTDMAEACAFLGIECPQRS